MSQYRNMNIRIKQSLGDALSIYRRCRHIELKAVERNTNIPYFRIGQIEIGRSKNWNQYIKLLDYYGKDIELRLVDRKTT